MTNSLSTFASDYHAPVMVHQTVDLLAWETNGVYVDATLGGGGHSLAILEKLDKQSKLIAIDRDADALDEARNRLAADVESGRFATVRGSFGDLDVLLDRAGVEQIWGILLDIGVSSHQLDESGRGFSHRLDAPLDMRMDQRQELTAADVVNTYDEDRLADVIYAYGEEGRSRRIARSIAQRRPVRTTGELAYAVRAGVPTRDEAKALARVFQAIRIEVNDELGALERALEQALARLVVGGRIVVLAYHSLEDRRVKRFFRSGTFEGADVPRDLYGNAIAPLRPLTSGAITASPEEIERNPRARSARLRAAEKVDPARLTAPS
jgi:16S rRNA (cytosine1402-N4)-methyltransferase